MRQDGISRASNPPCVTRLAWGAAPDGGLAATALTRLGEGVAAMSSGSGTEWPFGAILPWNKSQTLWHAWGGRRRRHDRR